MSWELSYNTPGDRENRGTTAKWQGKQASRIAETPYENRCFGRTSVVRRNKSYGYWESFKPWEKQGFGHEPGWQEKKQTRGRQRRTMESPPTPSENHWKSMVLPHRHAGGNVIGTGAICATCEILRLLGNLQNPLGNVAKPANLQGPESYGSSVKYRFPY